MQTLRHDVAVALDRDRLPAVSMRRQHCATVVAIRNVRVCPFTATEIIRLFIHVVERVMGIEPTS